MKKLAIMLVVSSVVSACGSNPTNFSDRVKVDQERQDKAAEKAIDQAPVWMTKLPKSADAVYENGTAVSLDFAMADMKAKTIAYAKICVAAGGKVRSQTSIFRSDSDHSSTEASELAVRSICPDIDITGVETIEAKHVAESGRIRSYVLVALPIGAANGLKRESDRKLERKSAKERVPVAFKELDELVTATVAPSNIVIPSGAQAIQRPDTMVIVPTAR